MKHCASVKIDWKRFTNNQDNLRIKNSNSLIAPRIPMAIGTKIVNH